MHRPSNSDLLAVLLDLKERVVRGEVLWQTLRDSHRQRAESAKRFEGDMRVQVSATRLKVDQVAREVAVMRPVVKRMRMREVLRRGFVACLGRWWGLLTTAAVAIGALVVWLGDHLPKLWKMFR